MWLRRVCNQRSTREETSWHKHVGWVSPASAFSSPLRALCWNHDGNRVSTRCLVVPGGKTTVFVPEWYEVSKWWVGCCVFGRGVFFALKWMKCKLLFGHVRSPIAIVLWLGCAQEIRRAPNVHYGTSHSSIQDHVICCDLFECFIEISFNLGDPRVWMIWN